MEESFRKIWINFVNAQDLSTLSNKIFTDGQELCRDTKEVFIKKSGSKINKKKKISNSNKGKLKEWQKHWKDITPFEVGEYHAYASIHFNFSDEFTDEELSELLEQPVSFKTIRTYYPRRYETELRFNRVLGSRGNPQYPIYIISKGRSQNCMTADFLIKMDVPFKIVIEKQEWDDYKQYYGEDRLLELDMRFREEYDTYIENFDNTKSKGSGPARNFVWWHSKNVVKSDWHWLMDDNIKGFYYYNERQRTRAVDGTLFSAAEDFINRYDNIAISGLDYFMFAVPKTKDRPYVANTKIYSCLLINNNVDFRWAGRYNEDVDICIRALKNGYSTIQFDAFLADKLSTQTVGGGNTEAFYAEEGTLPKSNMLMHNHPDITNVMWRFKRWHHIIDYDGFKKTKDETIIDSLRRLSKKPVVNLDDDLDIIKEIAKIDFSKIKKWFILKDVNFSKRQKIISVLKENRFRKDTKEILKILIRPQILDCDLDLFIIGSDVPETEDNKIMLDLIKLGNPEGCLVKSVDWDNYLDYVPEDKRKLIKYEMCKNKYLLKDYKKYEYDLKTIAVTEEEHKLKKDSKAEILNKINGTNLEAPDTVMDKKLRNAIEIKRKGFTRQLNDRGLEQNKDQNINSVFIHGCEFFENEERVLQELDKFFENKSNQEVNNSVDFKVDLFAANYALDNKLKSKEFVPDHQSYGKQTYKKLYETIAEYSDECILFITKMNDDLLFLVSEFEKRNKPVLKILEYGDLEDW